MASRFYAGPFPRRRLAQFDDGSGDSVDTPAPDPVYDSPPSDIWPPQDTPQDIPSEPAFPSQPDSEHGSRGVVTFGETTYSELDMLYNQAQGVFSGTMSADPGDGSSVAEQVSSGVGDVGKILAGLLGGAASVFKTLYPYGIKGPQGQTVGGPCSVLDANAPSNPACPQFWRRYGIDPGVVGADGGGGAEGGGGFGEGLAGLTSSSLFVPVLLVGGGIAVVVVLKNLTKR